VKRLALAAAAIVALAAPGAALAHASLTQQSPSLRQRLAVAPNTVVLTFDQPVDAVRNSIVVLDARGLDLARGVHAVTAKRELVASLPTLPRGAYTIRWRALSSDGHVVSGINTFGVRVPAPPVTESVGAQGPTRTEDLVRWIYFLALAFSVGVLGFRLLAAPSTLPAAAERRFFLIAGAGAVAVLEAGILAFLLRAEDALQLPFVDFIYGDLSSLANGTRFGAAFIAMTLGYVLVVALIVLAWLSERRWLLWLAFGLGLGFSSGLSLSGHSAADAGHSWLSELADWAHLGAAMLWVGGLVGLFAIVWPEPGLRRDAFLRFSRLATVLVAVLIGAGTYLSVLRFPHLHDLWRTGYGHVLLVKLGLVALALAWGAVHRQVVAPRLRAGSAGAGIRRSLLAESAVAMAVLLLAAVLVDSKPPPQPVPAPPSAASLSH